MTYKDEVREQPYHTAHSALKLRDLLTYNSKAL